MNWLKRHFEAWLIRRAANVLLNRNVARAPVVSRRDNNRMFEMGHELLSISKRVRHNYNEK